MDVQLVEPTERQIELFLGAFLASYRNNGTRRCYQGDVSDFLTWCAVKSVDPLTAQRTHIELWSRSMEERGLAPSTVSRRITAVSMWYRFMVDEEILDKDPTRRVKKPTVSKESFRPWLTRTELHDFLNAAEKIGGYHYALCSLLALNALRIGEVCNADISDLRDEQWHKTLYLWGKGDKPVVVPLPPRTIAALYEAIGDREEGPLILSQSGLRLSRSSARRIIIKVAKKARIKKELSPHSLRHSAITAALNSGASLRDTQAFARHADPRTTMRYDRSRGSLAQHPSYSVMQYVSGAS